jgi:hypothetical protein
MEQAQLSELVLSHQGSLTKVSEFLTNPINLAQSIALRLATLFYRSRMNIEFKKSYLNPIQKEQSTQAKTKKVEPFSSPTSPPYPTDPWILKQCKRDSTRY